MFIFISKTSYQQTKKWVLVSKTKIAMILTEKKNFQKASPLMVSPRFLGWLGSFTTNMPELGITDSAKKKEYPSSNTQMYTNTNKTGNIAPYSIIISAFFFIINCWFHMVIKQYDDFKHKVVRLVILCQMYSRNHYWINRDMIKT